LPEELFRARTDRVALSWSLARPAPKRLAFGGIRRSTFQVNFSPAANVREIWPGSGTTSGLGEAGTQTVFLFEETDYRILVESVGEPLELRHDDRTLLAGIDRRNNNTVAYGIVNFGGNVGLSTFEVLVGGTLELAFTVEVFPTKIDYEVDYRQLVHEVDTMALGLAFEFLRATHQGGTVVRRRGTTPEWLLLLRTILQDLERAVRQIERRPYRSLTVEEELLRSDRIRRADGKVRRSLRGAANLEHLPPTMWALPRRPSLRNPENAWIAAQLQLTARGLNVLLRKLRDFGEGAQRTSEIETLEALAVRIARLRRSEPIAAASDAAVTNFASFQLMRLPGYREAYTALLTLRLGLALEGEALRLSTKELHVLYEYWCFLAVIRILSEQLDTAPRLENLFEVTSRGLSVTLRQGRQSRARYDLRGRSIEVTYNPRFAAGLLTSQRPDITIAIEEQGWPPILMILDAKYRIDTSPDYVQRYSTPGPPDDAINVLHRYRDAVLEPSASVPLRLQTGRRAWCRFVPVVGR